MLGIPKELKDFSMWLNPTNLTVFNKMEMIGLARKVLKTNVAVISDDIQLELSAELTDTMTHRGEFALRVYFYQLFKGGAFSLDLRPSRFTFNDRWYYKGEHLAFEFDSELREALVGTYEIYYHATAEGLRHHLERMGLIGTDWTESDKAKLETIFMNHFQNDQKTKQVFHLRDLIDSFSKIFFFIKEKNGKVPSQFSLLGLYLTSLYMTLDGIKEPINVEACFNAAESCYKNSTDAS